MIQLYKDLLELAGSSGTGRVISKLVIMTFADAVLSVLRGFFFVKTYFLTFVWKHNEMRKI